MPVPDHVEGQSLVPLLENPRVDWNRPTLTTNGYQNHAITSDRYRYIRWADRSEELYDFLIDPNEFINLADDPEMQDVKDELSVWFPDVNAPPDNSNLSEAL